MLWLGGGGAALGGQCDMLGCRGDTEDGPGTLTGTHARRTRLGVARRGARPRSRGGRCVRTLRAVPQLRAATPGQHEHTRGGGAIFTKEWNGPGIIHSSGGKL